MPRRLAPECRRAVIQYAARENVPYIAAMERLIYEGLKAVYNPVQKPVCKPCINRCIK